MCNILIILNFTLGLEQVRLVRSSGAVKSLWILRLLQLALLRTDAGWSGRICFYYPVYKIIYMAGLRETGTVNEYSL